MTSIFLIHFTVGFNYIGFKAFNYSEKRNNALKENETKYLNASILFPISSAFVINIILVQFFDFIITII